MIKVLGIWIIEWLWCLCDLILKPRKLPYHRGYQREVNCGKLNSVAYQKWKKKAFSIRSDYGYLLSCELITQDEDEKADGAEDTKDDVVKESRNSEPEKRIAILCHGFGCAKYSSIKYVDLFLRLGFTVLIYDHRNHGYSGKALTSMGFFEKYDLKKLVDWCYRNYGSNCKVVTHGESMGGATVLMHLGIDRRVKCVIADCAYSDLKQLLCHQLKQFYHLPCFLIPVESLLTYLRAGFWYKQVSPITTVSASTVPVLFIHGKIDNLVPAEMSKQMYRSKKKNKAIYLVAGARHAESYCRNKEGYERVVEDFLVKAGVITKERQSRESRFLPASMMKS